MTDYIRRDVALAVIERCKDPVKGIQDLPGIGWIPMEDERKPLHGHGYFVAYRFGECERTFYSSGKFYAYGSNGYVDGPHFAGEGVDGMKVTHWMEVLPLPEPPKEGE